MTYVDTSDISAQMFVTVLLFLIVLAPLFSLGILRLFQSKKKAGFMYMLSGLLVYVVFQTFMSIFSRCNYLFSCKIPFRSHSWVHVIMYSGIIYARGFFSCHESILNMDVELWTNQILLISFFHHINAILDPCRIYNFNL